MVATNSGAIARNGKQGVSIMAMPSLDPAHMSGMQQNRYPPPTNAQVAMVAPVARREVRHLSEKLMPTSATKAQASRNSAMAISTVKDHPRENNNPQTQTNSSSSTTLRVA